MSRTTSIGWAVAVCLLLAMEVYGQAQKATGVQPADAAATISSSVDPASPAISLTVAAGPQAVVPRLMKFSGVLHDASGKPLSGSVDVTFSLYTVESGGNPLWFETQSVQADELGRYTALLGAMHSDGLPVDLFTSGEVRWLGIQVGSEAEQQPRVLLVSVPYALKAGDAETLGGKPASAYMLSDSKKGTTSTSSVVLAPTGAVQTTAGGKKQESRTANNSPLTACSSVTSDGTATANSIALFTTACNLESANLVQFNGNLGFGTTTPQARLHIFGPDSSDSDARFNFILGDSTPAAAGTGGGILFSGYYSGTSLRAGLANIRGIKENSIQGNYATAMVFDTRANGGNQTERMRITSAGSLGIGTSAPASMLEVNGTAKFDGAASFAAGQTVTGNVSASGQLISTVAPGTAPLSVTSTTQVPNLNASLLGGLSAGAFQPAGSYAATNSPNIFTGTQTISTGDVSVSSGNLDLHQTTGSGEGVINLGGSRFAHNYGSNNTFVGLNAGNFSTTGSGGNTATGSYALNQISTGTSNTANGNLALTANTTGTLNTAVGALALSGNISGSGNTASGYGALANGTNGSNNTAHGYGALTAATGSQETALGANALTSDTGSYNTAVGYSAGISAASGSNNTFIGNNANPGIANGLTNATAIGANAVVSSSNALVLGASGTNVGIGTATPAHRLDVVGDINASGNIVSAGAVTAASFSGSGSGLTSLTAANIAAGTAAIGITGNAATATTASNALALGGAAPSAYELVANKNAANGYAGLDGTTRIAKAQAPATTAYTDASNTFTVNQAITGDLTLSGSINSALTLQGSVFDSSSSDTGAIVVAGYGTNSVTAGATAVTIAGGGDTAYGPNAVTDDGGTVGGGFANQAGNNSGTASDAIAATVAGGGHNTASGNYSTVAGGSGNTAGGAGSFAAGCAANAAHNGAFVWADSTCASFQSTATNQFLIKATGGVGIGTNNPAGAMLNVAGNVTVSGGGVITGNGSGLTNVTSSGLTCTGCVTTADLGGGAVTSTNIANGTITGANIAIGSVAPSAITGVAATLGANTFTGTQAVTGDLAASGDINLAAATGTTGATVGVINLGGNPFIHACCDGNGNTFVGVSAGNFTTTALDNTASGTFAFLHNTTGGDNTGSGVKALYTNDTGNSDAAFGMCSLISTYGTSGAATACTLPTLTAGSGDTAAGAFAGQANTTGNQNTFVGYRADASLGNLINATAIGANAFVSESNAIVLGSINGANGATSTARVGIGTSAPLHTLDVGGDINASGNITTSGGSFTGNGSGLTSVTSSGLACTGCVGNTQLGINYAASTTQGGDAANALMLGGYAPGAFPLLTGGNTWGAGHQFFSDEVGIGTAPSVKLDVNGGVTNDKTLRVSSAGNDAAISLTNQGGEEYWLDSGAGGALIGAGNFGIYDATALAPRLVITPAGFVGIGTTGPCCAMEVDAPAGQDGGSFAGGSATYGGAGIFVYGGHSSGNPVYGGSAIFAYGGGDTAGLGGDGISATSGGSSGYAGYFAGGVFVNGTLNANAKNFAIDHPEDPANKYLYHSSVESSEMMNIYTGNVVLDARGEATVEFPDWFEALNTDFRYQLTAIGAPGPNLYIAQEIQGNKFKIAGGSPGMKVSWQVTGVRQDAYAKAHPLQVEVDKPERERGYYLNPELYGAPEEKGMQWARHPQQMQRMKEMRQAQSKKGR